jgi:excisionase family DNA binding protein
MEIMELVQDVSTVGTSLANKESAELVERGPLVCLGDLLRLLPKRPGGGGNGAAIHSAAAKFLIFSGSSAEATPIHLLETERERFVDFLKSRHHTPETVRSYTYCINLLLRAARDHGWETPPQILPPDWVAVMALTRQKEVQSIIRFAAQCNKGPSTFSEDDLREWCQARIQAGRSLSSCKGNMTLFRSLMSLPVLSHLHPLIQKAPVHYGTPVRKMHEALRREIEDLLSYLSDELEFDRPGEALRKATVDGRRGILERLVGFVENIQGCPRVEALSNVLTKEIITQYIKWATKERGVLGESMFTGFSGIHASISKHPKYVHLDLGWLPAALRKLPRVTQSEIDRRKEKRCISFEAANAIPGRIRKARMLAKNQSAFEVALSLRNELLMLWLIILPWRQRNLRECRLSGGTHTNLYFAAIPKHSSASQPDWLIEQEKGEPGKAVWQIYFSKDETKSKNEIKGFLPHELVVVLEEYLNRRTALIPGGKPDPGTLFVNENGHSMEVDGYLRLHPKTVIRMARQQAIPAIRLGKHWRFRLSDLTAWTAEQVQSTCQPSE